MDHREICKICKRKITQTLYPFHLSAIAESAFNLKIAPSNNCKVVCNKCQLKMIVSNELLNKLQLKEVSFGCSSCGTTSSSLLRVLCFDLPYDFGKLNFFKNLWKIDKTYLCLKCRVNLDIAKEMYHELNLLTISKPERSLSQLIEERKEFWDLAYLPPEIDHKSLETCFVDLGPKLACPKDYSSASSSCDYSAMNTPIKKLMEIYKSSSIKKTGSSEVGSSSKKVTFRGVPERDGRPTRDCVKRSLNMSFGNPERKKTLRKSLDLNGSTIQKYRNPINFDSDSSSDDDEALSSYIKR